MAEAPLLEYLTDSPDRTRALGRHLGRLLPAGSAVTIDGDLGAGKTVFTKGLAEGLGVTDTIDSPTYTLMKEYEGRVPFFHCDAWMQGRERAFFEGEGEDCLHRGGVVAIEWGERVADFLPAPWVAVRIQHRGPELRSVELALAGTGPPSRAALGEALAGVLDELRRVAKPPGPVPVEPREP